MTNKTITVNTYTSELVDNDKVDTLEMTLPIEWVKNKITDWDNIDNFLDSYTYDDTIGWLQLAIEDKVLLGLTM
ncbi:hypothetical protein [Mammaliicoccus sciuri]|uniref:hypothetical protein n=1 Tax=Mammaliicoccus sciuri TaxID=1296 RepID=UPI0021D35AF2|nr:hypothetical protein [Mammaliicoccus sciuri]UXU70135.1 hypothetical protein MUA36_05500 [Mammaliicoccus sciuri]WQL34257.1 hypothetical protein P3U41_05670 [Mammaliicoccus sciuri]WQL61196.1 hypothetical protein P3T96_05670 [Mammaliicoccus sciuri]